ncbi:hypothetical protein [Comamonas odontotermitis]
MALKNRLAVCEGGWLPIIKKRADCGLPPHFQTIYCLKTMAEKRLQLSF